MTKQQFKGTLIMLGWTKLNKYVYANKQADFIYTLSGGAVLRPNNSKKEYILEYTKMIEKLADE